MKIIWQKRSRLIGLFNLMMIVILCGCSKREHDQILPGVTEGKAIIKINVRDAGFEAESILGPRSFSSGSAVQIKQIRVNADMSVLAELRPDTLAVKPIARAGSLETLSPGTRYKVIVAEDGPDFNNVKILTDRDYIYGQEDSTPALELEPDKAYWFLAYSVNSTTALPSLVGAPTILGDAMTEVMSGEVDFMNFIKKVTVNGNAINYLDIIFKHQASQVTVTLDSRPMGIEISEVQSASMFGRYDQVQIKLLDGIPSSNSPTTSTAINFPMQPGNLLKATPATYYQKQGVTPEFSIGSIKMDNGVTSRDLKFSGFQINPQTKYNLNITFISNDSVGTYLGQSVVRIGGKVWKRFNEGVASTSVDPDIVDVRIWGKQWTWGYKDPIGEYNSIDPYSNFATKLIVKREFDSWNLTYYSEVPTKNTANDPCPSGFRIPTAEEFRSLIAATVQRRVGDFQSNLNNPTSALVLTSKTNSNVKLTLPAAGNRNENNAQLRYFDAAGYYQTSTSVGNSQNNFIYINRSSNFDYIGTTVTKSIAMSVRCIADKSDSSTIN